MKPAEKNSPNTIPGFMALLGGQQIIKQIISSDWDLIALCNNGLPEPSSDILSSYMGLSLNDFFAKIFDGRIDDFGHPINPGNFNKQTSSHIIEIAKVIEHTYNVFEDEHKAKSWLKYASPALNYATPIELFGTFTGIKMVNDVLGRIEHGVFS